MAVDIPWSGVRRKDKLAVFASSWVNRRVTVARLNLVEELHGLIDRHVPVELH
jgi:hypothetical protein